MKNELLDNITMNIIDSHSDIFGLKPSMYFGVPEVKFLVEKNNKYYLVALVSRKDNSVTTVVYDLKNNSSEVFLDMKKFIDSFSLNYKYDKSYEEMSKEINETFFIEKQKYKEMFSEIISNVDNFDINRYKMEYYPNILKYLSPDERRYYMLFSLEKNNTLNDKNNTDEGILRKYKIDENGKMYEEESKIKFSDPIIDAKITIGVSNLLDLGIDELKANSKRIEESNATYYYNSSRGGKSVIVADDGTYLAAGSAISFERLLEEFNNGRRNGNFNENSIIFEYIYDELDISLTNNKLSLVLNDEDKLLDDEKIVNEFKNIILRFKDKLLEFSELQNNSDEFSKNKILIGTPTEVIYGILDNKKIEVNNAFKNDELNSLFKSIYLEINSFVKKYVDKSSNVNINDFNILELSAIEKIGIPTKQHENTVLFISSNYAVVDNNKYDLPEINKQEIDNLIKNNYDELKKIFEEQTPEFLSSHIVYNNASKKFNLKLSNEEMMISYNTGTESDNKIKKIIDDITSLVFSKINNSNEFKNIMDNIFNGLTGDNKKDFEYLNKKTEEYKSHPLAKEIAREIGRKLYDILPDESKEQVNDAYSKDMDNINNMLKEVETYLFSENKDLEKAKSILLDFIQGSLTYDNDSETEYYNFNDVIDFVLYTRINKPTKSIKWIDVPFVTAYSYLAYIYNEQKNYDEALKMIDKTIRWSPMNLSPLFEKCETYKMQKNWEEFKNITLSIYDKIYNASDLAHYYRNLGYYYIEMNNLDLAYALYTASIKFEKNQNAYGEMAYINQQLKRENYNMSVDEGLKLLQDNGITFGPKQENLNRLTDLYVSEKELIKNPTVEMQLAERIYYLTLDKRFAPFFELVDKATGCSIIIPRSWSPVKEEIKKEKFGNKCMFAVYTDNNSLFQAIYDGKCSKEQFDEAYNLNVNNIKNSKNINIKLLDEGILTLKLQQGMKDFKHALFDMYIGDKIIRIIHYFTLINNIFVDFSINIDENIDYKDGNKFANQKNIRDMVNLLANIIELKNNNDTPKANTKDELVNKIDNKIIDLTNSQLDEINITFKNNKEISRVFDFTNDIFKKVENGDPFWVESAKNTFSYLLVKLLETNNTLNYNDIKEVLSDKNKFIDMCKNANTSLNNDKLIKIVENIRNSSDKMLDSYYDIILNSFKIITPAVETTTHNIKFNSDLNFNIIFPKELGTLTHPNDTSFKVGNNVTIMKAKCNSEDLLKKRANEWLENSAKTNNQTILSDLDKEYLLTSKQINVIEKVITKDNKKRYYKFIYYNQTMLIFGYNNKDLSKVIDDAIISLKLIKEQDKIQRDPFSKPSVNNNYLKRAELVNINDEFRKNIEKYDSFEIPNNLYLDYFSKLENNFNSHSFEYDKRFVTYGRLDFLRKELTQRLNDESLKTKNPNFKNQWDNRLGAYWDLSDFIIGDRHISMSSVPNGANYHEIKNLNDEYYKDGIICEQEKDILLLMIKEIRDAINSGNSSIVKEIMKFVSDYPIFLDNNVRLLSKAEIDNYKNEFNTNIDNIVPLFDLSDNEIIAYDKIKDEFIMLDISDDFIRNIDSIQKYIEMLKHKISSDTDAKDKFIVQKGEFQQIDNNDLSSKKVELYAEFVEDEDTNIEQIIEFVQSNNCDYSSSPIPLDVLKNIEKEANLKFGNQLTEYLTKYGYLGYKYVEFYGINSTQGLNSDMIKQTIYLHQNYEKTNPYIAIENLGNNCYALIDSNDNIYSCDFNTIDNLHIKLFDYILKRFNEVDNSNNDTKINNIDKLYNNESVKVSMFGKEKELSVFCTGDNQFDSNGNYKDYDFELSKEELDVLNWFINNIKIDDYKREIVKYCNEEYSSWQYPDGTQEGPIGVDDVENEINITAIAINVTKNWKANDGFVYPEISFYGECKCDDEHGICIGFRDKKFLGIHSQDWTL